MAVGQRVAIDEGLGDFCLGSLRREQVVRDIFDEDSLALFN